MELQVIVSELVSQLQNMPSDAVVATGEPHPDERVQLVEIAGSTRKIAVVHSSLTSSSAEWINSVAA